MKKTVFTFLLMLMAVTAWSQTEASSKIERVQVYLQGAEIHRTARLKLKPGRNEFKLTKLTAQLDPSTIQIGGAGFTILSVRHEKDFLKVASRPARIDGLQKQKIALEDSVKKLDLELSIIKQEIDLLNQNRKIVGADGINNEDFQKAIQYFSDRFKALSQDQFELKVEKAALLDQVTIIDRQITSESTQEEKASSNILLVINSPKSQQSDISIQYTIYEAGWFPAYDIRAIDTDSPLAISYKARVYQNSGIDWKNVKLRISSGNLSTSGTAPELSPYYLGGYVVPAPEDGPITQVSGVVTDETGQPLPQVTVLVKGTSLGTPTDAGGFYSLQIPSGKHTLVYRFLGYRTQEKPVNRSVMNVRLDPDVYSVGEVVVSGYGSRGANRALRGKASGVQIRGRSSIKANQAARSLDSATIPLAYEQIDYQTSFVYDIELPYNIPSTGKPEVVEIKTEELAADFVYTASPKVREKAYLMAKITGWEKLNLLDGESNLYFQNSFIGQSIIDTKVGSDTLEISLGKDEGIIVNRERKRDFEEKRFLSGKKREERHFEITVVNTKKTTINLTLYDQVPIAVRDNIKVSIDEISGADMNKETGLLTWNLKLKPGEKKVLQLKYTVDHPKNDTLVVN